TVSFMCVLLALAAPEIVRLVAPSAYEGAAAVVPVLLLASYFQFILALYLTAQAHRKRTWSIAKNSMLTAALNVALNIVLIPVWGYRAAAYVAVVSTLAQLAAQRAVVHRLDGIMLLDDRVLAGVSAATAIMIAAAVLLHHAWEPRWLLAALVGTGFALFLAKRIPVWTLGSAPGRGA